MDFVRRVKVVADANPFFIDKEPFIVDKKKSLESMLSYLCQIDDDPFSNHFDEVCNDLRIFKVFFYTGSSFVGSPKHNSIYLIYIINKRFISYTANN